LYSSQSIIENLFHLLSKPRQFIIVIADEAHRSLVKVIIDEFRVSERDDILEKVESLRDLNAA